jgi:hypothetical protein
VPEIRLASSYGFSARELNKLEVAVLNNGKLIRENGMNTLISEAKALRVWFDEDNLWLHLSDARQLAIPLSYFPRLLNATAKERENYELSGAGTGIHWDHLDEDISVQGLLNGIGDLTVRK